MIEELTQLLDELQERYGIADEDRTVLEDAIDATIQEIVEGGVDEEQNMVDGAEGVPVAAEDEEY